MHRRGPGLPIGGLRGPWGYRHLFGNHQLRFLFPRSTDLSVNSQAVLDAIRCRFGSTNSRPMPILIDMDIDDPPDQPNTQLRAIDLFCGAGGLSSGFAREGFDITLAADIDADSCETYAANFGTITKIHQASVADLGVSEIFALAGDVDVVIGGPSCQSFSTHGRASGWVLDDDRSHLWSHMHRIVAGLRPRAFCMENVPGMLYYDKGSFAKVIFAAFEDLGYDVRAEILLAANYSVPQLRRRLFVVGTPRGSDFAFPEPPRLGGWRRDSLVKWERERKGRGLLPHLTFAEATHDLPAAVGHHDPVAYARPASAGSLAAHLRQGADLVTDHVARPLSDDVAALARHVPAGGTWRDIPHHLLPDRFRRMRRTDSTNLLGRLHPDRPSYTVTTQFTNPTTGCFLHPTEERALTVREAARLQTFPDGFVFVGGRTSVHRQIGNAVPPLMARTLARRIRDTITDAPRRPAFTVGSTPTTPTTPAASAAAVARRMSRQRKHDTGPERALRSELTLRGRRYRVQFPVPDLPRRSIDVAFTKQKVAVFVHGCFWHGCPEHAKGTKSNTLWWADKIAENRKRDAETAAHLTDLGWTVVIVWEHEDPAAAATRVLNLLEHRQ